MNYDVIIIGGGVIGCSTARYLSRYDLKVCVLERCEDVCSGTSKANSGIVHAGFDAKTNSNKARFNVPGNQMMPALAEELDFDFRQNGSMVLCFSEADLPNLQKLYDQGIINGVQGLKLLTREEAVAMEPTLQDTVVGALYAPTGGIVCPFGLTIALAENAYTNSVEFRFLTEVSDIKKQEEGFLVVTNQGTLTSHYVVNAAGLYSDVFHNMLCSEKIHNTPRKGDYCLMDKTVGNFATRTIFQMPGKYGKGVLVSPTVHGNLLLGPTATDEDDKEFTCTTQANLQDLQEKAALSCKNLPLRQVITSFAGLRAHEDGGDFIIGEAKDAPGFFEAAGVESPGLSSAPAIGQYLAQCISEKAQAKEKANWNPRRKGVLRSAELSLEERAALIKEKPAYGSIVCRCEGISEGEIIDAITRPLGARSMDGIKRRVRQGMGRCQAGFCTPRAMELLSEYAGIPMEKICKNVPGSELIQE